MGEIKVDTVVTMHVIVRMAGVGKAQGDSSCAFHELISVD